MLARGLPPTLTLSLPGGGDRKGITLVEVLVCIGIIFLLLALIIPAIQRVRGAADQVVCQSKLHQLGTALHLYHQNHGRFPPGCSYEGGQSPQPHLSWMARLLPYLDQEPLWQTTLKAFEEEKFFLRNPPHVGVSTIMPAFLCPTDNRRLRKFGPRITAAFTSFQGVVGTNQEKRDGVLFLDSRVRLEDCFDGAEYTLMVGERPTSSSGRLGWWYAGWGQAKDGNADLVLGVNELNVSRPQCPSGPYEFGRGRLGDECDAFHYWSLHSGGAHFLMVGGATPYFRYSAKDVLPALATRAGHEPAQLPD